jgi:hypothetical protein
VGINDRPYLTWIDLGNKQNRSVETTRRYSAQIASAGEQSVGDGLLLHMEEFSIGEAVLSIFFVSEKPGVKRNNHCLGQFQISGTKQSRKMETRFWFPTVVQCLAEKEALTMMNPAGHMGS